MKVRLTKAEAFALAAVATTFVLVYARVFMRLVQDWRTDDNYSHGFLVIPVAAYLVWEQRRLLSATRLKGSLLGVPVVLGSLGLLVAGMLGAELFLTRIAMIGTLIGCILFLAGWRYVSALRFPLALLFLMVPIPAIIFNQIAFPLQLVASRFGTLVVSAFGIPVLREGNLIVLANDTLEVAEACSGIRSLMSLITVAAVYGYFSESRSTIRWCLVFATVPVAIVANGLRVAGTGIATHFWGPAVAHGVFHSFSGWVVFSAACGMLFVFHRVYEWLLQRRQPALQEAALPSTMA
jgi:exosortase